MKQAYDALAEISERSPAVPSIADRLAEFVGVPEAAERVRSRFTEWATTRQLRREVHERLRRHGSRLSLAQADFLEEALRQPKLMATAADAGFFSIPDPMLLDRLFRQHVSGLGGRLEYVRWDLFDVRDNSAAGTTVLTFWGTTSGSATYTKFGSNLGIPNYIDADSFFMVMAHRVVPMQVTTDVLSANLVAEMHRWFFSPNLLVLEIGEGKPYTKIPLWLAPPNIGVAAGAVGFTTTTSQPGFFAGDVYKVNPPVPLPPQTRFAGTMEWNAIRAWTTAGFVGWVMSGILARRAR